MVTRVKICGVRTLEGARAVREAGADLAGLNFVPGSKRAIDRPLALQLAEELGPVARVGVFRDQALAEVRTLAETLDLQYLQLHGQETPAECAELARTRPVIKALSVPLEPAALAAYAPYVELFLFDGPQAGSGRTFPWDLLFELESPRPYLIAGGLTPENVKQPITQTRPWGVDTASGVERGGAQDPERIVRFVKEAKSA